MLRRWARSRAGGPGWPHLLRGVHAAERPARPVLRGSFDADRVGGRVVQQRLAQRAGGSLGIRAPIRAHDVRGLRPCEKGGALPADFARRRHGERQHRGGPHELLRDHPVEPLEPGAVARGGPHALARHHGRELPQPARDGEGGAPAAGRQPAVCAGVHRRHDLAIRQRRVLRLCPHRHRIDRRPERRAAVRRAGLLRHVLRPEQRHARRGRRLPAARAAPLREPGLQRDSAAPGPAPRELCQPARARRGAAGGHGRAREPAGRDSHLPGAAARRSGHAGARAAQCDSRRGRELAAQRGGRAAGEGGARHAGGDEPVRFPARARRPAGAGHRQRGRRSAQARYAALGAARQHAGDRRHERGAHEGEERVPRRVHSRARDHARQGGGAASLRHVPRVPARDQQRPGPLPRRHRRRHPARRGQVSRPGERPGDHREARGERGRAVSRGPGGRADGRSVVAVAAWVLLSGSPAVRLSGQAFPTTPPKPTRLAPVRFPPFKETTLPNGLALVVIEHHEQPVVSVSLAFRAGGIVDPGGKEGLSELAAELLSKGTATRSAEQIASTIEGVGGHLSASSSEDFLTISADALSDQLELVFDLLGDVTLHSSFPTSELDLARTRSLSALALQLSQPGAVAQRVFAREIYGRNPYGRSPTRDSYRAVTAEDVTQFARERLRPGGALLVVAGDVTDTQVRDLVAKAFAGWRGTPPAGPALPAPVTRVAPDILLVHRPGSAQANIVAGNPTILPTDPVYYAGRVAAQVLGGGADSRLFLILREQKSWTYGAYASLRRYRGLGYWQATAEVRTDVADSALVELLHQIDRIRTEVIPDSELTAAKGFLVGSFPLTIETPSQIASQVANAKLLGLGDDYLRLYRERLSAVTALQGRAAAARLFRRSALAIVVVGDGAKLYDRLKAIAPVRIADVDGKALTPDDLNPPAAPLTLDPRQLESRTDSSQVVVQGRPLGFAVADITHVGDSVVYSEHAGMGNGMFDQRTTVVFSAADAAARRLDQVMIRQGTKVEGHLVYAGGRVKGNNLVPQPDGTVQQFPVDTAVPPGIVDENVAPLVGSALVLAPGQTVRLAVFTPSEVATKILTFKVGQPETVVVPAGTFQAYRVDVTGPRIPLVLYVSVDSPHRVVKQEFVGQPAVIELVK